MMEFLEPLKGNVELLSYVLFVAIPFAGAVLVGGWKMWVAHRAGRAMQGDDHASTGQLS